jgi:hypothetical protein
MELRTAVIGTELSNAGKVLIETLARAVRDHVDEFSNQLANGAWEEHGMDSGGLLDLLTHLQQGTHDDVKQEVADALVSQGARPSSDVDDTIHQFAEALFETLCEDIGANTTEALDADAFLELFSQVASAADAEEELASHLKQELRDKPWALEDPAIAIVQTLRYKRDIRRALDLEAVVQRCL